MVNASQSQNQGAIQTDKVLGVINQVNGTELDSPDKLLPGQHLITTKIPFKNDVPARFFAIDDGNQARWATHVLPVRAGVIAICQSPEQ